MKFLKLFAMIVAVFTEIITSASFEDKKCLERPADMSTSCCKLPLFNIGEHYENVRKKIGVKTIENAALASCKTDEAFFKHLNLTKNGKLDVDSSVKFMTSKVNDEDWHLVIRAAIERCDRVVSEKKVKLENILEKDPFHVKTGECDVSFLVTNLCFSEELDLNCPAKDWTSTRKCQNGRKWTQNCRASKKIFNLF